MTSVDITAPSQTESIAFEFDLHHSPQKVWRALTDPELLAEWLLPVIGFNLELGNAFTLQAPPLPGWDGKVDCRMLEIETHRKLRYAWAVGFGLDTVVTFTLTPTPSGTRLSVVQSGFKPDKQIYEKLVIRHGVDPTRACMADDIVVNLKPACDMGMRTVWIRTDESVKRAEGLDLDHIHHQTDDLATWLADWLAERNPKK